MNNVWNRGGRQSRGGASHTRGNNRQVPYQEQGQAPQAGAQSAEGETFPPLGRGRPLQAGGQSAGVETFPPLGRGQGPPRGGRSGGSREVPSRGRGQPPQAGAQSAEGENESFPSLGRGQAPQRGGRSSQGENEHFPTLGRGQPAQAGGQNENLHPLGQGQASPRRGQQGGSWDGTFPSLGQTSNPRPGGQPPQSGDQTPASRDLALRPGRSNVGSAGQSPLPFSQPINGEKSPSTSQKSPTPNHVRAPPTGERAPDNRSSPTRDERGPLADRPSGAQDRKPMDGLHNDSFKNLKPPRPATARPPQGTKYGDPYENSNKPDVYIPPRGQVPRPFLTEIEDANALKNQKIPESMLKDRGITLPLRTSYGKIGAQISLWTNYFEVIADPGVILWKYSLLIDPEKPPRKALVKRQRRRLLYLLLQEPFFQALGNAVTTDFNEIMITTKNIIDSNEKVKQIRVVYWEIEDGTPSPDSAKPAPAYIITIKLLQSVNLCDFVDYLKAAATDASGAIHNKENAVELLNVIVAHSPHISGLVALGGNRFYNYPVNPQWGNRYDLGGGLMAVRGYFASVRTSTQRALINVHTQTSAFYPPVNVWELMTLHGFSNALALKAFLMKLRVRTEYLKDRNGQPIQKVKTITGLSLSDASTQTFPVEEHKNGRVKGGRVKSISIENHFRQNHGIQLRHPQAPLIQVGNIGAGTDAQPVWLPPELATVMPGQAYSKKLDDDQTKEMGKYAARPPAENARRLVDDGLRTLGLRGGNPTLAAFGLAVTPQMLTVPARILPPPPLRYNDPKPVLTKGASWNLRKLTFAKPSNIALRRISLWAILQINCTLAGDRVNAFQNVLKECGLGDGKPRFQRDLILNSGSWDSEENDGILGYELTAAKKQGVKIILVVLSKRNEPLYGRIKFWADCKIGIHTVCCTTQKFANIGTYANVALKFNAKLGGTNHHVVMTDTNYPNVRFLGIDSMIIGIDVTHPSPNSQKLMPSVTAVVANIDQRYSIWPGSIRLQGQYRSKEGEDRPRPKEMVSEIEEMVKERLDAYHWKRRILPSRILIYRDGVSESQYDAVLTEEYPDILKACMACYQNPKYSNPIPNKGLPPVTIIIVGKRHHTRFYPTNKDHSDFIDGKGLLSNPRNGTVVDRGVTMEQGFDFFLQAHQSPIGTAKPAHYVIIKDDLKRSADDYQVVTHNLCYHYARATKAVSICPPAYYADQLCERGRYYLYKYYNADFTMRNEVFKWNRSPWVQASTPHPDLADSMFYL